MNNPDTAFPVRAPAQTTRDDTILPFVEKALDLRVFDIPKEATVFARERWQG